MKVILLENVKSHGSQGDVIDVSEGYARNFLFPQHLAVEATEHSLNVKKDQKAAVIRRSKKQEQDDKRHAKAMDGLEVFIEAAAEGGSLYGSVGPKEIALALKGMKYNVEPEWIDFASKKDVGSYEATINFPSGFEATLTIIIEAK